MKNIQQLKDEVKAARVEFLKLEKKCDASIVPEPSDLRRMIHASLALSDAKRALRAARAQLAK